MPDETRELHRIISASVRDMLDAYRLQAQAGPVSDQALEGIIFRAAHPVVDSLVSYPAAERGPRCCRVSCVCCWRASLREWREWTEHLEARLDGLPERLGNYAKVLGLGPHPCILRTGRPWVRYRPILTPPPQVRRSLAVPTRGALDSGHAGEARAG